MLRSRPLLAHSTSFVIPSLSLLRPLDIEYFYEAVLPPPRLLRPGGGHLPQSAPFPVSYTAAEVSRLFLSCVVAHESNTALSDVDVVRTAARCVTLRGIALVHSEVPCAADTADRKMYFCMRYPQTRPTRNI